MAWYYGPSKAQDIIIVLRSKMKPTESSHGHWIKYVTGPFRTMREAATKARYHHAYTPIYQHRPRTSRSAAGASRIHFENPRSLSLREFITQHRAEIDAAIIRVVGSLPHKNDAERRLWVLNDEGLYRWARSEGVRI